LNKPGSEMIYIGYSADLKQRVKAHTDREHPGRRLVYYEAYSSKNDARLRERRLKQYGSSLSLLKKRIVHSLSI
jgi:predicted GIY-YIG superfamily endonuclease